jgi:hypothetical protein
MGIQSRSAVFHLLQIRYHRARNEDILPAHGRPRSALKAEQP